MGCNCNNKKPNFSQYTTTSINNIDSNVDLFQSNECRAQIKPVNLSCDIEHMHPSDNGLIKFLACKEILESLDAAKEFINDKKPPLAYGEPAVLQYRDGDKVKLLFCIGGTHGGHHRPAAEMFQITPIDEEHIETIIEKMSDEGKLHIDASLYWEEIEADDIF